MTLSAHFLASAASLAQCPLDDEPEVAFVGRSNAGKSSTLNRLTGSRRLARVSKTPGRTQLINFFTVASGGRLVDLPGYGYAKASQSNQKQWGRAIDDYLTKRENLAAIVLIIDARRLLQPFDKSMFRWAEESNTPLLALLNKSDKLKQDARIKATRTATNQISQILKLEALNEALLFSAQTGMGALAAEGWVAGHLSAKKLQAPADDSRPLVESHGDLRKKEGRQ
jgi:GTP-binding protein